MDTEDAYKRLRAAIIAELYHEAYNRIQNLGGLGFHSENMINRLDAIDALNDAKNIVLAKL